MLLKIWLVRRFIAAFRAWEFYTLMNWFIMPVYVSIYFITFHAMEFFVRQVIMNKNFLLVPFSSSLSSWRCFNIFMNWFWGKFSIWNKAISISFRETSDIQVFCIFQETMKNFFSIFYFNLLNKSNQIDFFKLIYILFWGISMDVDFDVILKYFSIQDWKQKWQTCVS